MTKTPQQKEISQIHRIAGQIAGVERMLKNQSQPLAILQQIEAVKGNLISLQKSILRSCLKRNQPKVAEKFFDYLLKLS